MFRIVLVLLWTVLWCASLALPVVFDWRGITVLVWGWFGISNGQFGWIANLTFPCIALFTLVKGTWVAARLSAAGVQIGLAVNALFWNWVADEAGVHAIKAFGAGYYLWLGVMIGSAVVLLAVTFLDVQARKRSPFLSPPALP